MILPTRSHRGLDFTVLGAGCAQLGNLYRAISDEDAAATVHAAWDARHPLFRHGPALRSRAVGAAAGPCAGGLPAGRVRPLDQGRPGAGAEPRAPPGSATCPTAASMCLPMSAACTTCQPRRGAPLDRGQPRAGSGSTASTSSTCTTPTTTGSPRRPPARRPSPSCATRASSAAFGAGMNQGEMLADLIEQHRCRHRDVRRPVHPARTGARRADAARSPPSAMSPSSPPRCTTPGCSAASTCPTTPTSTTSQAPPDILARARDIERICRDARRLAPRRRRAVPAAPPARRVGGRRHARRGAGPRHRRSA